MPSLEVALARWPRITQTELAEQLERFSERPIEWAVGDGEGTADAHLPGEEPRGDKAGQPVVSP
jgi:hypothetical protein